MRGFTVVDLTPQCDVRDKTWYAYELLEKVDGAVDMLGALASELWRSPEEFETRLGFRSSLTLRWRASAETAGIVTIRDAQRQTLALSVLASGRDPEADRLTLGAFQDHVVRELHDTGYEPGFDLTRLTERPLVATAGFQLPSVEADRWLFILADRCFGAVYFRRLGLV